MTARKAVLGILCGGVLSTFAAACGSSKPEVIDVLFYGSGFTNYGTMQVSAFTKGEMHTATVTTNGVFLVGTWVDLDRGSDLTVDYFIDVDGNSLCDANDDAWTVERAAEATTSNTGVILSLTYDSAFNPAACSSF